MANTDYADVEIRIMARQADRYPVRLTFNQTQEFSGYLQPDMLDWQPSGSLGMDGQYLFDQLFADDQLQTGWDIIRGQSYGRYRVRLRIDDRAPELHVIPWELLQAKGQTLAANSDTPFSRYLAGAWDPGQLIAERPFKLLVAIADPANLNEYGLAAINRFGEEKIIKQVVDEVEGGQLLVKFLAPPVSLAQLDIELSQGYHLLHLVAHGQFKNGMTTLFLANDENWVQKVGETEFTQIIARQSQKPQLIFLASCQTATRSPADAWRGLAPHLISAGVPTVLAMQDLVPTNTARTFTRIFYQQLLESGLVDLASNAARATLLTEKASGAEIPVLFSRLPENRLFAKPQPVQPKPTTPEQKFRLDLLVRVRQHWIEGVLEPSLRGVIRRESIRQEQQEAVEGAWAAQLDAPERPNRTLPPDLNMLELFEEVGEGALLITGPPGSGKTTSLLELACQAIARAEQNPDQPIPVVLKLATWTTVTQNFADWLVTELKRHYEVDESIGRPWLENNRLLLLLDELEAVPLARRSACIKAINQFRADYGLSQIVVCSDAEGYEMTGTKLRLENAIHVSLLPPAPTKTLETIDLGPKADSVDLGIHIRAEEATGYPVELTLNREQQFSGGYLRLDALPPLSDPPTTADGERLFDWLFTNPGLRNVWIQIRQQSHQQRIQLRIDPEASALHALPWELMRDAGQTLAVTGRTPFCRYLPSQGLPAKPVIERPLKLLVAVANPAGLTEYNRDALDPTVEKQFITEVLFGTESQLEVTYLGLDQPLTLAELEKALRQGYHLVHFIGHSTLSRRSGEGSILLASHEGQVEPVSATHLVQMLGRLSQLPQLVILSDGQNTTQGSAEGWRALAPALLKTGVPTVLATQACLSRQVAYDFFRIFYLTLVKTNRPLDQAANLARATFQSPVAPLNEVEAFAGHAPPPILFSRVLDMQRFVLPQRALTKAETEERRSLLILLNKVRTFWIAGVLEASLHDVAMLELGKEAKMEAVERWTMTLERNDQPDVILSSGQQVVDIFDQLGGTLLILGAPGAGKTFALLELARDLLNRAEQNSSQPIPTVFNLSSWQNPKQSLADWMTDELSIKYQIPRKIGRRWIAENKILPLLDGLDEVRPNSQALCVQTINAFREGHRLTGVAVCSRTEAYEKLKNEHNVRLKLEGAIQLQPLSRRQIDDYLHAAGPQLAAVRETLEHDETLQALAETPLMLNVMSLAYQGKSIETLQGSRTVEERRKHLFAEYVKCMFERIVRTKQDLYPKEQMIDRLRWLAQRMEQHHQSVFLMEQLQPSWLSTRAQRWLYVLSSRLVGGFVIILALFGPITALLAGVGNLAIILPLVLLLGWLGAGTATGLILGLRLEWLDQDFRPRTQPSLGCWRPAASVVIIGVGVALAFIFACGLIFGLYELASSIQFDAWLDQEKSISESFEPLVTMILNLSFGLSISLIAGLAFGLIFGLRGSWQHMSNDIQAVEILNWSWRRFLTPLMSIGFLIGGLTFISTSLAIMGDTGFKLWDENGDFITALKGHPQPVTMVDFNANSTRIVTASEDGTVQLWDADGHYITGLTGHTDAVRTAKFNPNGSQILTADGDGTVRLWDGQDGRLITAFKGHEVWVASVRFNADGTRIATMGCDESDLVCEVRTARLWDQAGNLIAVLGEGRLWVTEIAFTPDGAKIVTGEKEGTARLWDRDGNLVATFKGQPGDGVVSSVSFNADGTRMVTISSEGISYLWEVKGELISTLTGQTQPITRSVPITGETRILRDVWDGTMRLWDQDGNLIANLEGHAQPVTPNGFNPNRTRILTIVDDGTMRLWDRDGNLITPLEGHAKQVTCGSFNPDHARIVTGSEDGSVRLWDSRTGQLMATLKAHKGPVTSAIYSPDGRRLLTTSDVTDNRPYAALWLLLGSVIGLSRGLRSGVRETKNSPNQGIRLSARNAVLVGLVGMLVGVLVGVLGSVLFRESVATGLFIGLVLGLVLGSLAALWYGGLDVIQHYILRFLLWRGANHIPWNYTLVLDYAAERILLRKVGGSYLFIHRLLQTYFSGLGTRSTPSSGA